MRRYDRRRECARVGTGEEMTEYFISLAVRALLSVGRAVIFDKLCSLKAQIEPVV